MFAVLLFIVEKTNGSSKGMYKHRNSPLIVYCTAMGRKSHVLEEYLITWGKLHPVTLSYRTQSVCHGASEAGSNVADRVFWEAWPPLKGTLQ